MLKHKIFILFFTCLFIFLLPISAFAIDDTNITLSGGAISVGNNFGENKDDMGKGKQNDLKEVDNKLGKYRDAIIFTSGLATITMVLIFMRHCIKLGVLGTEHWAIKRNSIMSLLWSGFAAALLGSMTTIFVITYKLFQ